MEPPNQEKTDRPPVTDAYTMKKTALVFGATGLVGSHLVEQLSNDDRYDRILTFTRTPFNSGSRNVVNHIIDFDRLEESAGLIRGNEIFCCLGTTIKKAGSQQNFRKVDLEYPDRIAALGSKNNVRHFLVISSIGANPESRNFYLQTKGQMEECIRKQPFSRISILRPSLLLGKRKEFRMGELLGKGFMKITGFLLGGSLKKFRGIQASTVARAMIRIANGDYGKEIYESDKIAAIGRQ